MVLAPLRALGLVSAKLAPGAETGLTVFKVTLTKNGGGINLDKQIDALLLNNTIADGSVGIGMVEGNSIVVEKNTINNMKTTGVWISNSLKIHVDHNTVKATQDGLIASPGPGGLSMRITNNSFTSNTRDGARVNTSFAGPIVFYNNTASTNGRDGLAVTGAFASNNSIVMGNTTKSNGRYGVAVNNDRWRVARNASTTNATSDLFWDGVGANTCFVANTFGTSIPGVLPVCP